MKNKTIILIIFVLFFACQKFTTVEVQKHIITKVKKEKMWDAVTQRWENKSFAILDDSTEVRINESQNVGDTVRFIYLK